jgi:hypothetical protein
MDSGGGEAGGSDEIQLEAQTKRVPETTPKAKGAGSSRRNEKPRPEGTGAKSGRYV